MIAAFSIIYLITYNNIQLKNQTKLNSISEKDLTTIELEKGTGSAQTNNAPEERTTDKEIPLGYSPSFKIEVDPAGNIVNTESIIDLPEETYNRAAEIALRNKKDKSTITVDGDTWEYKITSTNEDNVLKNGKSEHNQITFLDVTESSKTLSDLLITFLIVGLIMFIVIFLISLYFANKAIKPISENWERQKQFVADASHELKTPLSIINANYDALLVNQEETIESQKRWLDYIKIGTDRMEKLINDLLTLAKIDEVNLEICKIPFNISDIINEEILSMEAAANEKGITLFSSIEPAITVKSDSERIKQVISILFDNAIKYTSENGHIDISLTKSKHQILFSIKNTGKGIAKKDLPKIFDRFYRPDPSRTQDSGGFGLGLPIAKTIIDRLGGIIYVTSVENESTTFSFALSQ